jgi:thiol-disulfide isomerase/thioredoxin
VSVRILSLSLALMLTGAMPPLDGGTSWIGSPRVTAADLHGKVVLVDFWEYTCINCLRTLPYLRAWYERYHDDGFTIIGVHVPEFNFSHDDKNVAAAVTRLGVTWPVVLDDNFAIAKRYQFSEWPQELLFDQNGNLVETQLGEGNYQQTEAKIQELLRAEHPNLNLPPVMALLPQDSYDKPGAVCYLQTPETYVGPWHGTKIADAPRLSDPTRDALYADVSPEHEDGRVYLQGYWHASPRGDAMVAGGGDGYAAIRYHAIQVVTVMTPDPGASTRVNVTQDGKPLPKDDAGTDVRYDPSGTSYVTVDASRAYDIVTNAKFGSHDLRLAPQGFGLGVYSFAFESCEIPKP